MQTLQHAHPPFFASLPTSSLPPYPILQLRLVSESKVKCRNCLEAQSSSLPTPTSARRRHEPCRNSPAGSEPGPSCSIGQSELSFSLCFTPYTSVGVHVCYRLVVALCYAMHILLINNSRFSRVSYDNMQNLHHLSWSYTSLVPKGLPVAV